MLVEEQLSPDGDDGQGSFEQMLAEAESVELDAPNPDDAPAGGEVDPAEAVEADAPVTAESEAPAPQGDDTPETQASGDEPPADPSAETPAQEKPPFTFAVDGQQVSLEGAYEDGDNIVVPKTVWNERLKNYLADRGVIRREREQERGEAQQAITQLRQHRTQQEHVAGEMVKELDRILGIRDEAESYAEWVKLHGEYPQRKLAAERDYYKNRDEKQSTVTQQQAQQAEMAELVPKLRAKLEEFSSHALKDKEIAPQLEGATEEDRQELTSRINTILNELADDGLIYSRNEQGLQVDFQRIARVVEREVGVARKTLDLRRQMTEIEAAARRNAEKLAKLRPATPPKVSGKAPVADPQQAGKKAQSFEDLMDEAMNIQ